MKEVEKAGDKAVRGMLDENEQGNCETGSGGGEPNRLDSCGLGSCAYSISHSTKL